MIIFAAARARHSLRGVFGELELGKRSLSPRSFPVLDEREGGEAVDSRLRAYSYVLGGKEELCLEGRRFIV